MGDVWELDVQAFATTLRQHLIPGIIIVISTAPPCNDHSKVRDQPPGLLGTDGSLLQHMVDIEFSLRQLLPDCRIETVMENVLPLQEVQEHFDDITDQWGTQPMILDAADGNMTSRPRLWWNTIHWKQAQETISTQTPWQLQWSNTIPLRQTYSPTYIRRAGKHPAYYRRGAYSIALLPRHTTVLLYNNANDLIVAVHI